MCYWLVFFYLFYSLQSWERVSTAFDNDIYESLPVDAYLVFIKNSFLTVSTSAQRKSNKIHYRCMKTIFLILISFIFYLFTIFDFQFLVLLFLFLLFQTFFFLTFCFTFFIILGFQFTFSLTFFSSPSSLKSLQTVFSSNYFLLS